MPTQTGSATESNSPPSAGLVEIDIHPDWTRTPEFRVAAEISHWPDCTAAELLAAFSTVLATVDRYREILVEYLEPKGISLGEFLEMVADTRMVEDLTTQSFVNRKGISNEELAAKAKAARAVRKLFLAGFSNEQISFLLNFELQPIEDYLSLYNVAEVGRQVLTLHGKRKTPVQIAEELGITRQTIYRILAEAGKTPHTIRKRMTSSERAQAVKLYREGLLSYAEIADTLEMSVDQVKNAVRAAHNKGQCPEYRQRSA